MTYLDFLEQKVLLERLVIGLEEPVLIKGLGELSAKIDSGNGGYNVIHGTDFHQQGNELMFTTHDSFGHEKKIQATVIDTIEVNMGGGNIENRPVIELDIKFAGEDYKKIPFSVSDRSSNTNPILISKGFVENELEALIDVGKKNISNDGIDVVYGEGIGGFLKGAAKMAGKGLMGAVKTAASGVKNLGNYLQGGKNVNLFAPVTGAAKMGGNLVKGAVGAGAGILGMLALPAMGTIWSFSKLLKLLNNVVKEDQQAIRKKLPNSILPKKIANDKSASVEKTIWKQYNKVNFPKLEVFPIVSFKARVGDIFKGNVVTGMEARVKNWKSQLKKASAACKKGKAAAQQKQAKGQPQQQQESFFDESIKLFNDASLLLEFNELASMGASIGQANMGQPQTQDQDQPQQQELNPKKDVQFDDEKIQETATQFQELNNFILYFIPSSADAKGKQIGGASKEKVLELFKSKKFDNLLLKFFNVGKVTPDSTRKIVEAIASNLRDFSKNLSGGLYQGSFALVTGEMNKRQVHLFENVAEAVWIDDTKKASDAKQANENLDKIENVLNTKFPDLKNQVQNLDVSIFADNREAQSLLSPQGKKIVNKYNTTLARAERGASKGVRIQQETLDAILQPLTNGEGQTAIIKLTLGKDELGQQVLSLLGNNFTTTGWDDFISKCAKNEKVLQLLSDENLDTTPVNTQDGNPPIDNQDETNYEEHDGNPQNGTPEVKDDGTPTDEEPTDEPPAEPTTPPVEPNTDGEPTDEPTTPPVEPPVEPTEPSSTTDDRTPRFNDMENKITKSIDTSNTDTPPTTDTVPQVKRGEEQPHNEPKVQDTTKIKTDTKSELEEEEPVSEDQDEKWVKSKLQHFRNKGII